VVRRDLCRGAGSSPVRSRRRAACRHGLSGVAGLVDRHGGRRAGVAARERRSHRPRGDIPAARVRRAIV